MKKKRTRVCKWIYTFPDGRKFNHVKEFADELGINYNTLTKYFTDNRLKSLPFPIKRELNPDFCVTGNKHALDVIPQYGYKIRKCNKCHKDFKTKVDKRGWAIKTICPKCTAENKRFMQENNYNDRGPANIRMEGKTW